MSILLGEPLVPLLAYTIIRAVVDATKNIRYVESGLTGHLNDAQTFGLMRRIRTELCFFLNNTFYWAIQFTLMVIAL